MTNAISHIILRGVHCFIIIPMDNSNSIDLFTIVSPLFFAVLFAEKPGSDITVRFYEMHSLSVTELRMENSLHQRNVFRNQFLTISSSIISLMGKRSISHNQEDNIRTSHLILCRGLFINRLEKLRTTEMTTLYSKFFVFAETYLEVSNNSCSYRPIFLENGPNKFDSL